MNRIYEMTGDRLDFERTTQTRIKRKWGNKEKVLDIVLEELFKQTTYEGLGGEECSGLDREEYSRIAGTLGLLLGEAKTADQFFDQVKEM